MEILSHLFDAGRILKLFNNSFVFLTLTYLNLELLYELFSVVN